MRVLMTLLVRDEADVVAATVEHHLAAGVDFIVATDNGSRDGTVEILESYQAAGVLELHHEPSQDYEQGRWVTRMARRAAHLGADWVINADADEFFWPAGETTPGRDALPAAFAAAGPAGLVRSRRDNLVPDPAVDPTAAWVDRLVIRDTASLSARGTRIGPKVCHRADPDVDVAQGNHTATGPLIGAESPLTPLEILHVPDRGYEHYARKIANGGSAYAANTRLGADVGWHWREDYERLLDGELAAVYAARERDGAAVAEGLAAGVLFRDTRLADRLADLVPTAVDPAALKAVLTARPS
ncbi:glycosyltransferase family 2 protein [Saccharothrix carnea]|nr:glycosyltransferase family 2 protein [Saccharothrix carnea]